MRRARPLRDALDLLLMTLAALTRARHDRAFSASTSALDRGFAFGAFGRGCEQPSPAVRTQ